MTYQITNTEGRAHGAWGDRYETREGAVAALREAMGWSGIVLSHSYAVDDGTAWSAYESREECDADQDGAYAPRVVRS